MINVLPDVVRKGGENASVMEREKKGKARPSKNYKPLVERLLTDWENDNCCDSFIIANYDKENNGDYCNRRL